MNFLRRQLTASKAAVEQLPIWILLKRRVEAVSKPKERLSIDIPVPKSRLKLATLAEVYPTPKGN